MTLALLLLAAALAQAPHEAPQTPPATPGALETAAAEQAAPQHPDADAGGQAPAQPEAGGEPHALAAATHEPTAGESHDAAAAEGHGGPAEVMMHHVTDQPFLGLPSKHLVFFVLVAVFTIAVIRLALGRYDVKRVPRGFAAFIEMLVVFIRDDIAEANLGHDGRRFTPLLCSFFFFILVAALLGLVPFPSVAHGKVALVSSTSTSNLAVTLALAWSLSFVRGARGADESAGRSR